MKKLLFALALASAFAVSFSPQLANATDISVLVRKNNVSILEAAAIAVLADALGMDAAILIEFGNRNRASAYDYGPAFILGHDCHRSPKDVWAMRKAGKGWGVIAKELGMHPGTFNKMRVNGDFDRGIWMSALSRRYSVGSKDYAFLQGKGLGQPNIVATIALADGRRDRFDSIAASWKTDRSGKRALAIHESYGKGKAHAAPHGKSGGNPGKGHGKGGKHG